MGQVDFHKDRGLEIPKAIWQQLGNRTNLVVWTNLYFHCRYLANLNSGHIFYLSSRKANTDRRVNIQVFLKKMECLQIIKRVKTGTVRRTANEYEWIRTDLLPFKSETEKVAQETKAAIKTVQQEPELAKPRTTHNGNPIRSTEYSSHLEYVLRKSRSLGLV